MPIKAVQQFMLGTVLNNEMCIRDSTSAFTMSISQR